MLAALSIRTRILAAFGLSLVTFTGALVYGLVQLRSIGDGLVAMDAGYLPLAEVAADLQSVVRQMNRDHERTAREGPRPLAGHRSNAAFYSSSLSDAVELGREGAKTALSLLSDEDERRALEAAVQVLDDIDKLRMSYDQAVAVWLDAEAVSEPTGSLAIRRTQAKVDLDHRRTELRSKVLQLAALLDGRIQRVSEQTARAQTRAYTVGGTLAGLAILLAGALAGGAVLTLRPIGLLTAQVQRLTSGDYTGKVDVDSSDEVGVLAGEINALAEAVAERDRRLSERAEALDRLSMRLRQVLDTIQAGIVLLEDDAVAMANPAAGPLWGVEEGAIPSDQLHQLKPGRYEALALGERKCNVDVVPFDPTGGRLVVAEDVTQQLEDRERLARSARLALVGQMLAQVTHEVRNPLNAMSLNAELLAEELDSGEAKAMLATIMGEIKRLEDVTARYLDLSSRRAPELSSECPGALVREVVELEEEALRRAGVGFVVRDADTPVVELGGDALRRALRNVVRNAVEAGAGSLEVDVSCTDGMVCVVVTDDGPGMDDAQIARAFEPFYTTKAKGTGLGLAIGRQELEALGGSLRCQAGERGGCMFRLELPGADHGLGAG